FHGNEFFNRTYQKRVLMKTFHFYPHFLDIDNIKQNLLQFRMLMQRLRLKLFLNTLVLATVKQLELKLYLNQLLELLKRFYFRFNKFLSLFSKPMLCFKPKQHFHWQLGHGHKTYHNRL
ncbi:UNVERIFIED_CONTAM: hypothetical protein RF648_20295, partial [Kocuria sp. CPCC 205274]